MLTRTNPATIFLGGDQTLINTDAVSEIVTPGHLLERFNNAGVQRWRKHTNTTADKGTPPAVALNAPMLNKGIDDTYAAGDLAEIGIGHKGAAYLMLIASGQNISYGDPLESAGNGTLRAFSTGVVLFTALENKPNVTVQTRLRVEVV